MAESESAPRKTTTYRDFEGMASENQRYNVKPNEMFFLENIMRIAPHKLHSVPGPGFPVFFPPVSGCTDVSERGQQNFTVQRNYFNVDNTRPMGNNRATWSYMGDNEEIYVLVATGTCGGGSVPYTDVCCQISHFIGPSNVTVLPVVHPNANVLCGFLAPCNADTPFLVPGKDAVTNLWEIVYPDTGVAVHLAIPNNSGGFPLITNTRTFLKFGNTIYMFNGTFGFGDLTWRIGAWNATTGAFLWREATALANYTVGNVYATGTGIYVIVSHDGTNEKAIKKLDFSDGHVLATFDLTDIGCTALFPVSDSIIYVLRSQTNGTALYYIKNFTDLIYVGKDAGIFDPFGISGIFKNGSFYFGGGGFGGVTVNINKIAVPCPPESGPIIASISTGSTVAHGSPINVTWADILVPDVTDRIDLRPAPAAGKLGFEGPSLAHVSTGALAGGTVAFTIPGGTAPGDYIFQLTTSTNGLLLIATSNVFTVT